MSEKSVFNQKLEQIGGGSISKGISLRGENKEKILEFINANTSQNYIINNGQLICENINNAKKTILDEEILQSFEEERKIIITLSENIENDVEKYISENDVFERIILLKKDVFIKEKLNDEVLADRLTKSLYQYDSGIALFSSTATVAIMAQNQTVYHGPALVDGTYASVGSVDNGESVYVLATSMGWYHIQYNVGSTGKQKTGYIPQSSVASITSNSLTEEDFFGGYCHATTELDVRTCDDFSLTAPVGTLYKNEGCTFLFSYKMGANEIAFIEYSSSSGTKRGYVYSKYLRFPCETIVCIAKENLKVYAGPSTSTYAQLGSIYITELISVLAKEGSWIYVEYNTSSGRKRGYVDWNKVDPRDYTVGTSFNDFYTTPANATCHIVNESVNVYGGPTKDYAKIGTVNNENVTCFRTNDSVFGFTCIEYVVSTTGLLKRGYIDSSKCLTGALAMENNSIESFNSSYSYFGNKINYGQTQLGKDMFYYKAGTGKNHMFLVFGLHGWEDGVTSSGSYKHGDGNMLLKIAKNFINRVISMDNSRRTQILKDWSIFIFPGINLDGMVNGYTNNGFGRCLYNGYDSNRCFPGKFKVLTSPRNKTGSAYLGENKATEIKNLMNILTSNVGAGENILLDIHGWENSFLTVNNELASFYKSEMLNISSSFKHKDIRFSTTDTGFLITWARNSRQLSPTLTDMAGLGAKTGLLELPPTTDYSDNNINNNYGLRFFNATINVLENFSSIDRTFYDDVLLPKNKETELKEEIVPIQKNIMNIFQDIKSNHTPEEAISKVIEYDNYITSVSRFFKIRKALIQTVFMWEYSLEGKDDIVSDTVVKENHTYNENLKEWLSLPENLRPSNPPKAPLVIRNDSSTGLCQIYAKTAIEANNWGINSGIISGSEYDLKNLDDLWYVWNKLHTDNDYNIEMAGLVLLWGAVDEKKIYTNPYYYSTSEIKQVIARYNGTNDEATAYGERNYALYEVFEKYNKLAREA